MPKVTFVNEKNEKQEVEVPQGSNLRKEARKAGIPIHGMALSLLNPVANVLNCMGNGNATCLSKLLIEIVVGFGPWSLRGQNCLPSSAGPEDL